MVLMITGQLIEIELEFSKSCFSIDNILDYIEHILKRYPNCKINVKISH